MKTVTSGEDEGRKLEAFRCCYRELLFFRKWATTTIKGQGERRHKKFL